MRRNLRRILTGYFLGWMMWAVGTTGILYLLGYPPGELFMGTVAVVMLVSTVMSVVSFYVIETRYYKINRRG